MILSMHLADVGAGIALRTSARPDTSVVPGWRYAQTAIPAPVDGKLIARPSFRRLALLAAWDDDAALDRFLDGHPLADRLAGGWSVRLVPLQASGAWSAVPELGPKTAETVDDDPVAVVTLGKLKLRRAVSFLRANRPASRLVSEQPGVLFATGLARPPHFVSTFSLWRTAREMKAYAYGGAGPGHRDAIAAQHARSFHHESCFARFRPYAATGEIDGREPLDAARPTRA